MPEDIKAKDIGPSEWRYNLAKTDLWDKNGGLFPEVNNSNIADPNLKTGMKIISTKTYKDFNRPDIRELDSSFFQNAPQELESGKNQEDALKIMKDALGMDQNNKIISVKSPIETIQISEDKLNHIVEKRNDARERYANYIIPTLTNPFEIYLSEYEDGYRRQYIGLFTGKNNMLCVVRLNKNGSILLWNIMHTDKRKMNKHRVGDLVWFKE